MLEKGKTYSWEEFWKYCKIGETYKINLVNGTSEEMPILNPNEKYLYVAGGHNFEIPYFFKATEFLATFLRFLGDKAKDVVGKEWKWYGIAPYYECGNRDGSNFEITINRNTINELMEQYGVEDREIFENEYLNKLPNVTYIGISYDDALLEMELEECDYFGSDGEYTLKIKEKKDNWKIEVDGKGLMGGDMENFWGLLDEAQVTLIDIL